MCGRFYYNGERMVLKNSFPELELPELLAPRYNIAPGQPVAVIPNCKELRLDHFQWGLVPSWAKDVQIGNRLINARGETVAEKPSFRAALRRRRCLVPADGFYEWYQQPGERTKTPLAFRLQPPALMAFAGLWEVWQAPDGGELFSMTIITCAANSFMAPYHERMPVILPAEHYAEWLDPCERDAKELLPLLQPYPASKMAAFPVSTRVNNVKNDDASCLQATGEIILPVV